MENFEDENLKTGEIKEEILSAVVKRALGYSSTETQEERDAEMSVIKQKTIKKEVPPCLAAAKFLMERLPADPYVDLSDEELEKEKLRLLRLLEEENNASGKSGKRKMRDK